MPVIINGPITIDNITGVGEVQFGDLMFLTPKTISKAEGSSGEFNTGGAVITNTGASVMNYMDPNAIDQPIYGNK